MTTTSRSTSSTAPTPAELLNFAAEQTREAASALWPDEPVVQHGHVPSVTGYVERIEVGGRPLFAKMSILGVSLVSLLRGAHGPWPEIRRAQLAYTATKDSLLQREAAQLRLLAELGRPRVCAVAGMHRGVLLTEPVPGPTLADWLASHPEHTAGLLNAVMTELGPLHRHRPDRLRTMSAVEHSITGTFSRKFAGPGRDAYVRGIGAQTCQPAQHRAVVALLRAAITALLRYRPGAGQTGLVFGGLKPEHIKFPVPGGAPVLLDPGLRVAGGSEDLARLISRTLLLALTEMNLKSAVKVVSGVSALVDQRVRRMPRAMAQRWLRELIVLWLMDSISLISTYLTAPQGLPLPRQGKAVVQHALLVASMLHKVTTVLDGFNGPGHLWDAAMSRVLRAAST